jgi:hypothetical protein
MNPPPHVEDATCLPSSVFIYFFSFTQPGSTALASFLLAANMLAR